MSPATTVLTTSSKIPDWVAETALPLDVTFVPLTNADEADSSAVENIALPTKYSSEVVARQLSVVQPVAYLMNGPPDYGPFFDADLAANSPNLRLVTYFGDSLNPDHYATFLDIAGLREKGITVTTMPGAAHSVAEATFALILALNFDLVPQSNALLAGIDLLPDTRTGLDSRTLGVAGMGLIGQRVAELGAAFGMRILYATQSSRPEIAARIGANRLTLEELFEHSDVVSIHLPGVTTRGLIDHAMLAAANAITLVNTSSAPDIVDPAALIEALKSGTVEKVAIEGRYPPPYDEKLRAYGPERVLLRPAYTSWNTHQSHRLGWQAYLESLRAFVVGEPIPHQLIPR